MTAIATAAGLLAGAICVAPPPPRRRVIRQGEVRLNWRAVATTVACSMAMGLLFLPVPVVLAVGISLATLGHRHKARLRDRERKSELHCLAAALSVLVGELRVGAHPARAFQISAAESAGQVSRAMRAVAARAELGGDVQAGLTASAVGSAAPGHWHRLALCWGLAAHHGLAISTLMSTALRDVVERQRFSARLDADLAGARATAAILAGLPVLGVVLGQLIGARPLQLLLGRGAGGWLVVAGVVLICLGLGWSERITGQLAKGDRS